MGFSSWSLFLPTAARENVVVDLVRDSWNEVRSCLEELEKVMRELRQGDQEAENAA
jgi:hypothetical protein